MVKRIGRKSSCIGCCSRTGAFGGDTRNYYQQLDVMWGDNGVEEGG
jgi:hypothetical protein